MLLDTITALQSTNDYGRNALDVLDQKIDRHRLLRTKPELDLMVENIEALSGGCAMCSRPSSVGRKLVVSVRRACTTSALPAPSENYAFDGKRPVPIQQLQ